MVGPYRDLLAVPGARVFVAAGFVGRMSMSMLGIGIVLFVSAVTGSYGIAGAVSAVCALCFAAASPVIGRLADRYGQRRVLVRLVPANTASAAVLVLCAEFGAPVWTLFTAAGAVGLTSPSLGAMVRARWTHALRARAGGPPLHTAFSFESVLDELIFVTGPVLVTFLATQVHPAGGVAAASLFTLVGSLVLAAQRRSQPPSQGDAGGRAGTALGVPGVRVLVVVFLMLGAVFGAVDVTAIAFAAEDGRRELAGVLLALYALGSGSAALWYGARSWTVPLDRRFLAGLLLMVAGLVPLALITRLHPMMFVIFFSGLAISPTIIPGYGLIERLVPAHRLTEGLTLVSTAVGIGVAVGASAAGQVVDARGAHTAFLLPLAAGVLAALVGLAGRRTLAIKQT
ncbi:MFS transporter [Actinomadura craniellae]|uniref:MFS transporter n=1 Tax=Actinomadura craniellae TaxID=2231787 RepID=A0A365GVV1_9ACTN|nr:MFS transporter [Actinomadura craniellae]RAY10905.1 MFS transporter [Actinomadura craniellae]